MRQALISVALLLLLALPATAAPVDGLSTWWSTVWNQVITVVNTIGGGIVIDGVESEASDVVDEEEEPPTNDLGGHIVIDG